MDINDIELLESKFPKSIAPNNQMNVMEKLCRLCLHQDDNEGRVDIFEETDGNGNKKQSLKLMLYELFQIKYDKTSYLPHAICQRCLEMVNAFSKFRQIVKRCEAELQERAKQLNTGASERPGLNGNPGVFEPEDDCEITEVNPEQDYESSEDDFSMESDSEAENVSIVVSKPNDTSTQSTQATKDNVLPGNLISQEEPSTGPDNVGAPTTEITGLEFNIKNTYLCQYCDMAFKTQLECSQHEVKHDASTPYICSFCPKRFSSRQSLIAHIRETHDSDRPYVCANCNKGFCRRSDLKKHTIVHTGVRPFSCPICMKSFSRNTNLTKHMRVHSSVKSYGCKYCSLTFTNGIELLKHVRSHVADNKNARKDKPQELVSNQVKSLGKCPISQNTLATRGTDTIDHNENSLNMTQTQQTSALFSQLQQRCMGVSPIPKAPSATPKTSHYRSHVCDICSKTFTRERDLHRHQALHLDTLFTCKQCGLGFSRREKLTRHEIEQHTTHYPCEKCRITFPKHEELEIHMKMHELQQNAALSAHQAVLNAAGAQQNPEMQVQLQISPTPLATLPSQPPLPPQRTSDADFSFYSNMVPTMNLGFYSETRPEDRNGI
uniref:Protein krueppel n=1 Tax=Glossina brevipalpis TaxID=37001 RepID=A0A1A9WFY8_9MUSC